MKLNEIKESVTRFFKSVSTEFKKITWPTPPQAKAYTVVVLFTLLLVTAYLTGVRYIVEKLFKWLNL